MYRLTLLLTTSLALSIGNLSSHAGTLAGQLTSQMVLQAGCVVSGDPGAENYSVIFGTLQLGNQPNTFSGVLTAPAIGGTANATTTLITCSSDISSLSVSVNAGDNVGPGSSVGTGPRAMKFGISSYVPYQIYSDAALTSAYPTAARSVGLSMPGTGAAVGLPIYTRVNKTDGNAVTSRTNSNLLQVTLSW